MRRDENQRHNKATACGHTSAENLGVTIRLSSISDPNEILERRILEIAADMGPAIIHTLQNPPYLRGLGGHIFASRTKSMPGRAENLAAYRRRNTRSSVKEKKRWPRSN